MKTTVAVLAFLAAGGCASAVQDEADLVAGLQVAMERLRPLHRKIRTPDPADWLAQHREEGQTFAEYVRSDPVKPQGERKVIYIQPIGTFSATQRRIVNLTSEYMAGFFNLPLKTNEAIALSSIPASATRLHPAWGDRQILTTYVLDEVLKPNLPADAAAMIALTTSDLWPGKGWNFLFGQASTRHRVGVWSIYRNGDPDTDAAAFRLCLKRTIKLAVHETGHMFSMDHCIAYECCMCGSNHREESDRQPLYLCPECMAKICWVTRADPVVRYRRLMEFCRTNGFDEERKFFEKSIRRLED